MYLEKDRSLQHSPNAGENRGYLKILVTQMEYPTEAEVLIWEVFKTNEEISDEVKQTQTKRINSKHLQYLVSVNITKYHLK